MADERQQPGRDAVTPPAAGANPPMPQAAPGTPAPPPRNPASPSAQSPSENDIFGAPFAQPPTPDDLFASLTEFVSEPALPDDSRLTPAASRGRQMWSYGNRILRPLRRGWRQLSLVQKILGASIAVVATAVLYVLLVRTVPPLPADRIASPQTTSGETPSPQQGRPSPATPAPAEPVQASLGQSQRERTDGVGPASTISGWVRGSPEQEQSPTRPEPAEPEGLAPVSRGRHTLPAPEPLSLQLADKLYLSRDFEPALAMYDKLYRRLPGTDDNQPLRDFLLLRMALCSKNSGHVAQADSMFRTASLSRLPILRALARYHQGTILLGRKRYLEATAKAYQAAALIEVANYDKKWVTSVQQQCGFLAAESMTRNLLSLCDADANLPKELWSAHPDIDPFVEMDEPPLRVFLASGLQQLEGTVLGPQIRVVSGQLPVGSKSPTENRALRTENSVPRWSVICNGAPIEELLARLAANAGVNIRWTGGEQAAGPEDNVRARPVYLYLTSATAPQVIAAAAGSVGLIARTDDKGVCLLDPTSYSSLADHTSLLAQEAITLWQRLLLMADNDPRAATAHFALALLQTTQGQFDQAMAEYKLVANRFAKHALAPDALLQSGMLKVRLRDYTGAHADLKQLVELYPETALSDRACLYLADATMKAGRYEEAVGLYRKVYNLGLSVEAQAQSALGAGRCLYETQQYEEAAQWLSQYTTLARDQDRPTFSAACLLLGKAYLILHKPQQAQAALNLAIKGELSRPQHVETVAVLVRTYLEQGLYVQALHTLENTSGWQLSQLEGVELVLLRAQAYRAIGLADRAAILLEEKAQYLPSPALHTQVALELARCYLDTGSLESARKTLTQAFATAEPGPVAEQIGRELAGVCLRLGQTAQAVSVCAQLLQTPPPAKVRSGGPERASASERQATLALLADAYRKQGRYDQAVAAMLDRYEGSQVIKDN